MYSNEFLSPSWSTLALCKNSTISWSTRFTRPEELHIGDFWSGRKFDRVLIKIFCGNRLKKLIKACVFQGYTWLSVAPQTLETFFLCKMCERCLLPNCAKRFQFVWDFSPVFFTALFSNACHVALNRGSNPGTFGYQNIPEVFPAWTCNDLP